MKRKKLLKALSSFLQREEREKRRHRNELDDLLRQLGEKEAHLEEKLQSEKEGHKKKRLRRKLETVRAQRSKGMEVLHELEEN